MGSILKALFPAPERECERCQMEAIAVEYSATIDNETCPACKALDGMIIDLRTEEGKYLFNKYSPAQHEDCRCIWIELMKGDGDIPRKDSANNRNFEKNFVKKFNKENSTNLTLAQIANKYMQHNLNWSYLGINPWAKEKAEIEQMDIANKANTIIE